jgi:hypothetical protein
MDTYDKINDGLGDMWMYHCLLNVDKWGCGLIYQDKKKKIGHEIG